jgi:general secretion pathway protein M
MMSWLKGLDRRERWLVSLAATLTGLVIIWQFVVVPATAAHQEARAELAEADTNLARLQEAYMRKRAKGVSLASNVAGNQLTGDAFKTAVTNAASEKGLSISRLQGGSGATVGLVFEQADPRFIFFWLEDVETRLNGTVTRLVIEQAGGGRVRASIDVSPGGN